MGCNRHAAVGTGAAIDREPTTQALATDIAKIDAALAEAEHAVDAAKLRQAVINQNLIVDELELPRHFGLIQRAEGQGEREVEFAAALGAHAVGEAVDIRVNRALLDEFQKLRGRAFRHAGDAQQGGPRSEVGDFYFHLAQFGAEHRARVRTVEMHAIALEHQIARKFVDARPGVGIPDASALDLGGNLKLPQLGIGKRKVMQVAFDLEAHVCGASRFDRVLDVFTQFLAQHQRQIAMGRGGIGARQAAGKVEMSGRIRHGAIHRLRSAGRIAIGERGLINFHFKAAVRKTPAQLGFERIKQHGRLFKHLR